MDIRAHNREAWDRQVEIGDRWTQPVSAEQVQAARAGRWSVLLTPSKPVPNTWFPPMKGLQVLCLACGGGQQGPVLAAAGARVTVLDNSPRQLERDEEVARREGLEIRTLEGDMRELTIFRDESFDLVFHPVANTFVPDVRPVWREAFRLLRPGGALLAGFVNPTIYTFDPEALEREQLVVRYPLPYSDLDSLDTEGLNRRLQRGDALEWSHTFEAQIAGQLEAGFLIAGFYGDADPSEVLSAYMPGYFATRALKPATA